MEEEHRRILREALLGKAANRPSFKDYLLEMPDIRADSIFDRAKDKGRKVRIFGEMVAILWGRGLFTATIRLEQLWNDLGSRFSFSLFCAYPLSLFANDREAHDLLQVCAQHDLTIPAEHSW